MAAILFSCNTNNNQIAENQSNLDAFNYKVEQFSDIRILRYQVPGFEELNLNQKQLVYYLSKATLAGRDIIFDQNYKFNLAIRRSLENIFETYKGDTKCEDYQKFIIYLKKVWFSNGIHHHYSTDKFFPEFSQEYFKKLVNNSEPQGFPVIENENIEHFIKRISPIIFDPKIAPQRVSQESNGDLIKNSACNFYEGVTQNEVETYYSKMKNDADNRPISHGLNSKVVKENGKIIEKVYKIDGMYGAAIEKIVFWLEKALTVTENEKQGLCIKKLIEYYKTGDLKTWDDYNVLWVADLDSRIDMVNGFIEDYGDPMGMKATWEAVVNFKDIEASKRADIISQNAQWFENNSPVDKNFKKEKVTGVSAKVITVAQLGGDCYPSTPIGINLPNADWIRKDKGSKSVTLENITYAYDQASLGNGFLEEFTFSPEEKQFAEKYGFIAGNLHTDLHECLGHGSGKLLPSVSSSALKNYGSPLEETRADLFALYFIMDQKMLDLGLIPSLDVAKAEYDSYIRNGLMTQLTRIEIGKDIQQAHMRNRQLIAQWCFENGREKNVIEKKTKDGKTYFVINDYEKLRQLFGKLLAETQRIKSEGDYKSGAHLVETYGVKVNKELHKEVLERYKKLKLAPYSGFINPEFVPVMKNNKIVDIKIEYQKDYSSQMLKYSKEFSFLPTYN